MKSTTIATALLSALLAGPTLSLAQEHDIEHLVIEMASTPQEHRAVAQHYTMKAEEAREQARRHEGMARIYAGQRSAQPQRGRQHCENLAKNYQAIATEYEELAKLHQEQSRNPAQ
jgi:predicted secreted protein